MDGVDPTLVATAEQALQDTPGVRGVAAVRLRWLGHTLHAEADVVVDMDRTLADSHAITEAARHELLHQLPRLADATIHADPCRHDGAGDPHAESAHHRPT
jgi:divalent metal cation (Fe/Co/Zn/Cd) transporter